MQRYIRAPCTKNLVFERKISDVFDANLVRQRRKTGNEKNLNTFLELATACCSLSQSLRPNTKILVLSIMWALLPMLREFTVGCNGA
jgi:hypothetical protein